MAQMSQRETEKDSLAEAASKPKQKRDRNRDS